MNAFLYELLRGDVSGFMFLVGVVVGFYAYPLLWGLLCGLVRAFRWYDRWTLDFNRRRVGK